MIEQEIIIQLNKVIYKRKSLSFHLDFKDGKEVYIETFTHLELSPEELELLCQEVEASNLRKMKPIKFMVENEVLPMIVLI